MTKERDYNNYKPYRTKAQKAEARRLVRKDKDGAWKSSAPVSYHYRKKPPE